MITEARNLRAFSKFIFVGILNTLVGYGLFALLVYLNIFYLLSLSISHIVGTTHSYLWNRYFTFNSKNRFTQEFPKFITVYASIYVLNFALLYLAVDLFKFNVFISQLVILGLVTAISFIGQRYWAFKN